MIWGLAFLLRELWAGSYVASLCTHAAWIFKVNAIGQRVWSLFICLWEDGEEKGRSHTVPEERCVGVLPLPPFHNNGAKDSTCRELVEHFLFMDSSSNYWQCEEMKHRQTPHLWFIFWNRSDKLHPSSVHAPSRAMQVMGGGAYSHITSWLDDTCVRQWSSVGERVKSDMTRNSFLNFVLILYAIFLLHVIVRNDLSMHITSSD